MSGSGSGNQITIRYVSGLKVHYSRLGSVDPATVEDEGCVTDPECPDCDEQSGSGSGPGSGSGSNSGAGSGASGGSVVLPECSDFPANDLQMIVEGTSGVNCDNDGTYTLIYDEDSFEGNQQWSQRIPLTDPIDFTITLQCIAGVIYFSDGSGQPNPSPIEANDDPFLLVYQIEIGGEGSCSGQTVTFTITDMP